MIVLILAAVMSFTSISCGKVEKEEKVVKPQVSQMKSICELATMECYYHNVAKYSEEDAQGALWWKKDKHFWIEYSGIVKIGIDASRLNIKVEDEFVTITLPPAKVLSSRVDETSLTKDSFYKEKNSADVTGEDQTKAFKEAQENMENEAANDSTLLANAQQRAQILLEEYVTNIGNAVGKEYSIEWKYLEDNDGDSVNKQEESNETMDN